MIKWKKIRGEEATAVRREYGRRFWWVLCALWLAVIFLHSLMSAERSAAESGSLLAWLRGLFPALTEHALRKLAHFSEFAVLGLLLAQCLRARITRPLLAGVLCALADETVQLFVSGRSGEVRDVWIDFSGVAAAVAASFLVRFLRSRRASVPDPDEFT